MELREKIARLFHEMDRDVDSWQEFEKFRDYWLLCADRILALPEIAEALKVRNAWLADQMPDLPQERVGEIMRNLGHSISTGTKE